VFTFEQCGHATLMPLFPDFARRSNKSCLALRILFWVDPSYFDAVLLLQNKSSRDIDRAQPRDGAARDPVNFQYVVFPTLCF